MAITVRIFHSSLLFSQSLVSALSQDGRFSVSVANSVSVSELAVDEKLPDAVLISLHLVNHLAVILAQHIFANANSVKVILLLEDAGIETDLLECVLAGAQGCVLEGASLDDLKQAISDVVAGEVYFSPKMTGSIFRKFAEVSQKASSSIKRSSEDITQRQLEIARLIEAKLSNKEIARKLNLSLNTVKNHIHQLLKRLGLKTRLEAAEYVRRKFWRKPLK